MISQATPIRYRHKKGSASNVKNADLTTHELV